MSKDSQIAFQGGTSSWGDHHAYKATSPPWPCPANHAYSNFRVTYLVPDFLPKKLPITQYSSKDVPACLCKAASNQNEASAAGRRKELPLTFMKQATWKRSLKQHCRHRSIRGDHKRHEWWLGVDRKSNVLCDNQALIFSFQLPLFHLAKGFGLLRGLWWNRAAAVSSQQMEHKTPWIIMDHGRTRSQGWQHMPNIFKFRSIYG